MVRASCRRQTNIMDLAAASFTTQESAWDPLFRGIFLSPPAEAGKSKHSDRAGESGSALEEQLFLLHTNDRAGR